MKKVQGSMCRFHLTGVLIVVLAALLVVPASAWCKKSKTLGIPGVQGGVVTTSEPQAAQVGAEILRQGGNAIDAAAAVQFALNVLEPQSSGIGGGAFIIVHMAKKKKTIVVDARETAPAAAEPDMFVGQSFGIRSTSGIAVGVPGTLAGFKAALDKWGTMSLAEVLDPAIGLAEDGIRVSSRLADSILSSRLGNEIGDPAYDEARDVFRPGSIPLKEGDLLVQPDLAETFKMIAADGIDAFYTGDLAEAIVQTQLATRSGNPDGVGRMTTDDLAGYQAALREPVEGEYRGFRIVSMPPPSSGGLTVIQILKLLERFPMGDVTQEYGLGQTQAMHVFIEACRLAFADRAVWMGDTDFVDLPVNGLIDDGYVAMRSALIDPDMAADLVEADDPRPFEENNHKGKGKAKLAQLNLPDMEGLNTTHFTIVDRDGNIVTCTTTIESAWGTGLMVPGYGFMLNNELTDFNGTPALNLDPGNFNPGANDVAAGKRPRSSMAPTLIFDNKKPLAAFGSPGGSSIINTVAQMAINLIDHRRTVQEAVDAPRLRQTVANGDTRWELGFSDEVFEALEAKGHSFTSSSEVLGSVQAIVLDKKKQYGAADKRRIGGVVSVRKEEIVH
jgi:gamma-glutamyltranspeptidase/glutathione hydrolase